MLSAEEIPLARCREGSACLLVHTSHRVATTASVIGVGPTDRLQAFEYGKQRIAKCKRTLDDERKAAMFTEAHKQRNGAGMIEKAPSRPCRQVRLPKGASDIEWSQGTVVYLYNYCLIFFF